LHVVAVGRGLTARRLLGLDLKPHHPGELTVAIHRLDAELDRWSCGTAHDVVQPAGPGASLLQIQRIALL